MPTIADGLACTVKSDNERQRAYVVIPTADDAENGYQANSNMLCEGEFEMDIEVESAEGASDIKRFILRVNSDPSLVALESIE